MKLALYIGDVNPEGLRNLVVRLRGEAPYAVLSRVDCVDFPAGEEAFDPAEWEEGRIFGPHLELRWQATAGAARVVLVREDDGGDAGLAAAPVPANLTREERLYYLWGEDEMRLGRSIRYRSAPGSGRPRLTVAEFYNEDGELWLWRYVSIGRQS